MALIEGEQEPKSVTAAAANNDLAGSRDQKNKDSQTFFVTLQDAAAGT